MTDNAADDRPPVTPIVITGWDVHGATATYSAGGTKHRVTLDEAVANMHRLAGALQQAALAEKMQPGPSDPEKWLEGTPLWALFNAQSDDELRQMVMAFGLAVSLGDQFGELTALYMETARGLAIQMEEPDAE